MQEKRKALSGGSLKGLCGWRTDRASDQVQQQYKLNALKPKAFDLEAYSKAVDNAMRDAYVMLKDWPAQARFGWYVDRNGKLRCWADGGEGR